MRFSSWTSFHKCPVQNMTAALDIKQQLKTRVHRVIVLFLDQQEEVKRIKRYLCVHQHQLQIIVDRHLLGVTLLRFVILNGICSLFTTSKMDDYIFVSLITVNNNHYLLCCFVNIINNLIHLNNFPSKCTFTSHTRRIVSIFCFTTKSLISLVSFSLTQTFRL